MKNKKKYIRLLAVFCTILLLTSGCDKKNYYNPDTSNSTQDDNAAVIKAITLEQEKLELNVGEAVLMNPTVSPDNAKSKPIKWSSSNSKILDVNQQGVVFAKQSGNADITVSDESGGVKAICSITVGALRKAVFTGTVTNQASPGQTFDVKVNFENCLFPSVKVVSDGVGGSIKSDAGTVKFSGSAEQNQVVGDSEIAFTISGSKKVSNLRILCYDNGILFDSRDYNITVTDEAAEKEKLKEEIKKEILESLKTNN